MRIIRIHILILIFAYSCQNKQLSMYNFNNELWNIEDSVIFSFNIQDTAKAYNISLFFRNTLDYPYQNLFILAETHYNDNIITLDTLEYLITNKYGQWEGRGLGKLKNNYFIFNPSLKFSKPGSYSIILRHGMRMNPLKGSDKIGFKIE